MYSVVTTRYTNETWDSRERYKSRKNIDCIYASPFKMTASIQPKSPVFIVEMNNSINEIMCIGLIQNKLELDKKYNVYENANYNRYVYLGKYYISREVLLSINEELVYILDEILFKGYTHSKRGAGFTKIPEKVLQSDKCKKKNIHKEIRNLFVAYYKETTVLSQEPVLLQE